MSAVCEEDLKKPRFQAGDLRQEISSAGKVRLVTVFVQCDAIEGKVFYEIKVRLQESCMRKSVYSSNSSGTEQTVSVTN